MFETELDSWEGAKARKTVLSSWKPVALSFEFVFGKLQAVKTILSFNLQLSNTECDGIAFTNL